MPGPEAPQPTQPGEYFYTDEQLNAMQPGLADKLRESAEAREMIGPVPGMPKVPEQTETHPTGSSMQEYGGYTNIRHRQHGIKYEPGMPLRLDVDTNPKAGDPRVEKLT